MAKHTLKTLRRKHRPTAMLGHLSILCMKELKVLATTFSKAQLLCILTDGKDYIRVILKKMSRHQGEF